MYQRSNLECRGFPDEKERKIGAVDTSAAALLGICVGDVEIELIREQYFGMPIFYYHLQELVYLCVIDTKVPS